METDSICTDTPPNSSTDCSAPTSDNACQSHVHFPSEQIGRDHELGIVIQAMDEWTLEVHLGFLKLSHHYTIEFDIIDNLGEDVTADPLQNLHCKITSCAPTPDGEGHHIVVDFHAHKDKLVKESLMITGVNNSDQKSLTLILMARVLGKHKGTPMLKDGIKCVGQDPDEESDQSDWGGFN